MSKCQCKRCECWIDEPHLHTCGVCNNGDCVADTREGKGPNSVWILSYYMGGIPDYTVFSSEKACRTAWFDTYTNDEESLLEGWDQGYWANGKTEMRWECLLVEGD